MRTLRVLVLAIIMTTMVVGCGREKEETEKYWHEVGENIPQIEEKDIDPTIDRWFVDEVANFIPYSPEGWDGDEVVLYKKYTNPNTGKSTIKEYIVAALPEDGDYDSSMTYATHLQKNGQNKWFKLQGRFERTNVLIHQHDGIEEYFSLTDAIDQDYAYVIDNTDQKVLIKQEFVLFVYDSKQKNLELITEDFIDYKIVDEGVFFIDCEHEENFIDWKADEVSIKPTGVKKFRYWDENESQVYVDCYDCDNVIRMEGSQLFLYRYGKMIYKHLLPEGNWNAIGVEIDFDDRPNSKGYAARLKDLKVLLFNFEEMAVYTLFHDNLTKVAEDVQDFQEAYGELYWMDSQCNAYELSWTEDRDNILIGIDVAGISYYIDERAGFLVRKGDPRANNGSAHICSKYGNDWLNQEYTSGSWYVE